jgi:hypothetical protein
MKVEGKNTIIIWDRNVLYLHVAWSGNILKRAKGGQLECCKCAVMVVEPGRLERHDSMTPTNRRLPVN